MGTTEIAPAQNFEQRMRDRIRDSIGELLSDEELSKLISRSMEDLFFKERISKGSSTWDRDTTLPPLMHSIVKELMAEKVRNEVAAWLNAHPEEVKAAIEKVCSEGAGNAVVAAFTSMLAGDFSNFRYNIEQRLQARGI